MPQAIKYFRAPQAASRIVFSCVGKYAETHMKESAIVRLMDSGMGKESLKAPRCEDNCAR